MVHLYDSSDMNDIHFIYIINIILIINQKLDYDIYSLYCFTVTHTIY